MTMKVYVAQHQFYEDSYNLGAFADLKSAIERVIEVHELGDYLPTTDYVIEEFTVGTIRPTPALVHEPPSLQWDVTKNQWWAGATKLSPEDIQAIMEGRA